MVDKGLLEQVEILNLESGYYSRLDNIVVHNPESDILQETDLEKKLRKEKIFSGCSKNF